MREKSLEITNFKSDEKDDEMTFTAIASTSDLDRHGEIVSEKALKRVAEKQKEIPMFFGHSGSYDQKDIVGRFDILGADEKGLKVKGVFLKDDEISQRIYKLLKMRAIKHLSIGFLGQTNDKDVFDDIELIETSIVPIPANPKAEILEVKNIKEKEEVIKMSDEQMQELMNKLESIETKIDELMQGKIEEEELSEEEKEIEELKSIFNKKGEEND